MTSSNRPDSPLSKRNYERPQPGDAPMGSSEHRLYLAELPDWTVIDDHHLSRSFQFPDFLQGLAFVNAIAGVAEDMNHHPDLTLSWGRVGVEVHTHDVDGLSIMDFVLAARIDGFYV